MSMVAVAIEGGAFRDVVVSGGLVKIWEARRACSSLAADAERERTQKAEAELYGRELKEFGEEEANVRAARRGSERAASLLFGNGQAPLWRVLSGLMPGMDWDRLHPNERAGRLTVLIRAVEKIVRYEWRAFEKTRDTEDENEKSKGDDPRVRWWDPMRVVCEHFGIAYSMLSRIAREVAGLGASDLTDRVKAETVRSQMREDVKEWVREIFQEEKESKEKELDALVGEELADAMWSRVTKKRGRGRWSRSAWAVRFGYSSYTRFQRACLAEYGVSPVELERAVMEEVLKEKVQGQKSKVEGATTTGAVLERGSEVATAEGVEAGEHRSTLVGEPPVAHEGRDDVDRIG